MLPGVEGASIEGLTERCGNGLAICREKICPTTVVATRLNALSSIPSNIRHPAAIVSESSSAIRIVVFVMSTNMTRFPQKGWLRKRCVRTRNSKVTGMTAITLVQESTFSDLSSQFSVLGWCWTSSINSLLDQRLRIDEETKNRELGAEN